MPLFDYRCRTCGHLQESLQKPGTPLIPCALCGDPADHVWVGAGAVVRQDSVPGGFVVENLDRHPRTFYSKSEYQAELKRRGLTNDRYHAHNPRGPHSTKWD